VKTANLLDGAL